MSEILSDKALKRIEVAERIHEVSAQEDNALTYMANVFASVTLPHSKVEGAEYVRSNGDLTLIVTTPTASGGIPYGVPPRLILAWLSREVVLKKSRIVELGGTLPEFLRKIGITPTGGARGTLQMYRRQAESLFASTFHCQVSGKLADIHKERNIHMLISDSSSSWWGPKKPGEEFRWESEFRLSQGFYEHILEAPVVLDNRVLSGLKGSALEIDLYIWLTYRLRKLRRPLELTWEDLALQFGAGYNMESRQGKHLFKTKLKHHLKRVLTFYPEARVSESDKGKGLLLLHSPPHVPAQLSLPGMNIGNDESEDIS